MGYDFHITRKEYWFDDYSDARDITLSEWLSYIKSDSELELTEGYWIKIPAMNQNLNPRLAFVNGMPIP